ncbi:MAG: LysM peptidoglycan-binding domain-containing protein [Bacteroidales bacterium]|nr:LysM peptidoglycan-binding domain-containing protein [Bacteroidales bacterium]
MSLFLNRKLLFIVLGFALFQASFAQEPVTVERSNNKVILEGKVFYIHVVKPGQTLYSIAKAYYISQKEIAIENPGVMSGLQIGQALKIPLEPILDKQIDTSAGESPDESVRTHTVQPDETIYSIARSYNMDETSLLDANEGVESGNLQPGQKLVIPGQKVIGREPVYNEEGFVYYKVKRYDTLYSIARFYNVAVREIRTANPELGWGGPKTGQVIRIPLPQVIDHPETALDTVPVDSRLHVQSDSLLKDYNYEELMFQHDDPNRTYRIACFIPFDFQKPEPLDSLIKNMKSVTRRNRITERYRMEQKIPQAVNYLEFFQGTLLAIDSLRQTGMRLDVRFYDTRKSMDHTRSLLENGEMEDMDLIIGPFYTFNLDVVSTFARKNKIPLVTPFYSELDFVRSNPYLFQLSPSLEKEYQEVARLIASKHTYNIVYVRGEDSLDIKKLDYFKELIFDGFDDYRPVEPVIFKEVILKLEHTDEIIHSLSPDRKNLVIVPTSNEAFASPVVSSLYYKLKDFEIEVIGTPFWTEFSTIDYRYYHELNLIYYSSFWVDYLDPQVNDFLNRYRNHFYSEPISTTRKGINYGIVGYDMTFYFINALRLYGPRFILSLDEYQPGLVQNSYSFSRVTSAGGYENKEITFYQFSPDMSIGEIEVPELPVRSFFFRPMEDRRKRYLNLDRD